MTLLLKFLYSRLFRSFVALSALVFLFQASTVQKSPAETRHKELLLGIEPQHNIFDQMQKYRVLAGYLSDQLGIEFKLTIMSRYGEVVKRFKSLHLDGAILSSFTATLAMEELYLTPLAYLVNKNDSSTSRGLIFVRKDSGIANVSDMKGKNVVFVDPATTEGYVFARAFFHKHGVGNTDLFFSHQDFTGSHASVIYAVLDGRADIGSAKDTVYNQLVSRDPSIQNELKIIAESPPVPEVTLCLKGDLDPELTEKIRTLLLNMDKTVEGYRVLKQLGAKRFAPASAIDFSIVVDMVKDAGLDLLSGADQNIQ